MPRSTVEVTRVSVPTPDPTLLTTQQLLREVNQMREIVDTRFAAMDRAIDLLQKFADRSPTTQQLAEQLIALRELHEEKFNGVQTQFRERDVRTEQASRDGKVAIDAALQAQKEAVGKQNESNTLAISKSENTFTKQIDAMGTLISATAANFNDKIDDIKARLNVLDGQKSGIGLSAGVIAGLVAGAAALSAIIVVLIK